jgi:hypothetical protein
MFRRRQVHIRVNQSESKIGLNRAKNISATTIAGKIVNHTSDGETVEQDVNVAGGGESIAICYSKNVWVNGKRVC